MNYICVFLPFVPFICNVQVDDTGGITSVKHYSSVMIGILSGALTEIILSYFCINVMLECGKTKVEV